MFNQFLNSYLEAAFFTTCLENEASFSDILPEDLEEMKKEAKDFYEFLLDLEVDDDDLIMARKNVWYDVAGRDFWLTRNGHGAGFGDGHWSERVESALLKEAHKYNECHIEYEDGKVWFWNR